MKKANKFYSNSSNLYHQFSHKPQAQYVETAYVPHLISHQVQRIVHFMHFSNEPFFLHFIVM